MHVNIFIQLRRNGLSVCQSVALSKNAPLTQLSKVELLVGSDGTEPVCSQVARMLLRIMSVLLPMLLLGLSLCCLHFSSATSVSESLISASGT